MPCRAAAAAPSAPSNRPPPPAALQSRAPRPGDLPPPPPLLSRSPPSLLNACTCSGPGPGLAPWLCTNVKRAEARSSEAGWCSSCSLSKAAAAGAGSEPCPCPCPCCRAGRGSRLAEPSSITTVADAADDGSATSGDGGRPATRRACACSSCWLAPPPLPLSSPPLLLLLLPPKAPATADAAATAASDTWSDSSWACRPAATPPVCGVSASCSRPSMGGSREVASAPAVPAAATAAEGAGKTCGCVGPCGEVDKAGRKGMLGLRAHPHATR